MLYGSINSIACRHKTDIPSCLTVTYNSSFLFKSYEEGSVQKSVFKANQIRANSDYAKMFHEKY